MSDGAFTVFLVDDDAGVLKALSRVLRSRGYEVRPYASPQAFLADHDPAAPGCAVFDVAMPGLDGLALQHALTADGAQRPVIFITGKGDVPTSVRAMKAGAVDFLTKPVEREALLSAIENALARDAANRLARERVDTLRSRLKTLTIRERDVFTRVVAGKLNKQIATELGTSERTVKAHRAHVMAKMQVNSLAELIHLAEQIPGGPSPA